ncbi:hypothetical protein RIF29_14532 [Crotalaria pallida]|uniref:JmjC domain-containing protein n=1 Tax=Crotalaria pallida TaxID=3830 RepID=A0AAN9FFI3_CROPI
MKLKDYVSYINVQHDEDPLYVFDQKFGEVAPSLLKDYCVPHLFQEDYFDIIDTDKRPSYRWLIIGPQRSGASWHVDPALTSAWNTLLCGRKRWALYPPGKVPLGVTVHVSEEDGDVNIDTPSSLQWWLDFYPLLADEDKPIECTQLPGETIYVPSGWWHCVLNLETTIVVTQNFVNSNNFEFVCLDMVPGYRHKGVCRVGLLALDEDSYENVIQDMSYNGENLSYTESSRKEKRAKTHKDVDGVIDERTMPDATRSYNLWKDGFSYDITFLSSFLDKDRDHYSSLWSSGNSIGQRELREWLYKLWIQKPKMRELIWKGSCIALNADKWLERLSKICAFHNLPPPTDDERLPVGSGSNPLNVSIFLRFKQRVLLQACSCQLLDMLKMMVSLNPKEFAPPIWKVKCTACNGITGIYVTRVQPVPSNEVSHLFSVRPRNNEIAVGTWARVKSGHYKGDIAQAVIEAGLIGPLVILLQNAEFDIKKEAAWAISNATSGGTHEQIKYLVSQGCIKPLCELLICPDPRIITVCLEGLENILKVGEVEKNIGNTGDVNIYAQMIDDAEGLEKIESLQSHDNNEIYEKAVKILETYWLEDGEDDQILPSSDGVQPGFSFASNELPVPSGGFNFS